MQWRTLTTTIQYNFPHHITAQDNIFFIFLIRFLTPHFKLIKYKYHIHFQVKITFTVTSHVIIFRLQDDKYMKFS